MVEDELRLFEWKGYVFGIFSFLAALVIIYSDASKFFYSVFAATLSALLFWGSYLVIRMVILAIRK